MTETQRNPIAASILRTVAFFDTMDYPPTWTEVCAWGEFEEKILSSRDLENAKSVLVSGGLVEEHSGRLALKGRLETLLLFVQERTALFPRKLRAAQRVARWLVRNPAVRFVALANTTALAHARDAGDLDFFVIVRHGSLWSTRLLGGAPYRLTGRLAGGPNERPDAVCLSYLVSDATLNLSSHQLSGDDPYFRYWFLALLPLFDDGVSSALWNANTPLTRQHPRAIPWIVSPDVAIQRPMLQLGMPSLFERAARAFQTRWFPPSIRQRMNQDSSVIVNDSVLKFHVDDGRETYRSAYRERLRFLNL